ncbi:hypothetical protein HUT18_30405 [Streptomyces sp. NA04227]|uniref:hypothetical protein n=1 Tax=Streptomyces sp. NA04227 TaxID=2742136 RepID=UPI001590F19D|nr:hypothetical protein [Streptomyces sp. NA04227]QKW10092.1 hypothetical protein HUT18_30405 [Streptomyces sp. NA04227]
MNDELTVLAEAGSAALVAAMATDLWQETRESVTALFRRSEHRRTAEIETQLDDNAALVREASAPDEVRRALFAYWTLELAALLRHDPSCREPLHQLASARTPEQAPWASSFRQTVNAHGSGTVFAVQHGTQHAYGAPAAAAADRAGQPPGAQEQEPEPGAREEPTGTA